MHRPSRRPFARFGTLLGPAARIACVVGVLGLPSASFATPVAGFVDHIGSGVGNWGGGDGYSNPGTGGVLGAGDGFLLVSTLPPSFQTNLGARSLDPAYQGDWSAAGITQVKLSLKDVGNADPLEIHFCVGSGLNFWQYDVGFVPATSAWTEFTVDLTSASWTQIVGSGTFASALAGADRILIRHDVAPYGQFPDAIEAEVGIDEIKLLNGSTAVPLAHPGTVALALAAPSPNPSAGPVSLAMETSDPSPISIVIVDALGRRVRQASLAGGAGQRSWTWDGRTDGGEVAPAGVYRVRASNASGGTSRPLVRIAGSR